MVSPGAISDGVAVNLALVGKGSGPVSFGVPVAAGLVPDAATVRVFFAGTETVPPGLKIKPLLYYREPTGKPTSVRALLVQFAASAMSGPTLSVEVRWKSSVGAPPPKDTLPFSATSSASDETVEVTDRTMVHEQGRYRWAETPAQTRVLFASREPRFIAVFPDGYLADSGILGPIMSKAQIAARPKLAGLAFVGENLAAFTRSAIYRDGYAYAPAAVKDPVAGYEAWLYDRCATLLLAHAYDGNVEALRSGMRQCAYYASKIHNKGYFTGKPQPDTKYSHMRGLFAYYALTGDERALKAMQDIRALWLDEPDQLVRSYATQGQIRSTTPLWTERILGTCFEGLLYGFLLDGDATYYAAFTKLLDRAHFHITTQDRKALEHLTRTAFPPQDCFIHSARQHAETIGDENTALIPWCSGWMNELLLDALLRYREVSPGDTRVDAVFLRLARFLRDTGSTYLRGQPLGDTFLAPSRPWNPAEPSGRLLVPAYGSGIDASGKRVLNAEKSDSQHCADTLSLTAMAVLATRRLGQPGKPVGPFGSELDSFAAMHHDFAHCARVAFEYLQKGRKHDPRSWSEDQIRRHFTPDASAAAKYMQDQRLGFPANYIDPQRKYSWWFNTSLFQYRLLDQAGLDFATLKPGQVQP